MSKAATELIKLHCPNEKNYPHEPHVHGHAVLLAVGEIILLPRIYFTDVNATPRQFGVKIPFSCCTECWNTVNLPDKIRVIAEQHKQHLKLETNFIENKSIPYARKEVSCLNADHMQWHRSEEALGNTHDVVARCLFVVQPLEYLSYVDYNVYQGNGKPMNSYTFELEIDSCLHCIDQSWNACKTSKLDKIVAKLNDPKASPLTSNPDFSATFHYFGATAFK